MPGRCPKCGATILKRKSKKGYVYYACERGAECGFMTWDVPHFSLLHSETLHFTFSLTGAEAVRDLLSMTPHVWRISRQGAEALAQTDALTDTAEIVFNVYGRHPQEKLV